MGAESKALKTVVVGLKRGKGLTMALIKSSGFELTAVCDIKEDVAKEVAAAAGSPKVYTDYMTMLAEEKPEVVVIATPTYLHAEMTFQAVEAGVKGIYCEKPMAVNMADARAMVDRCREKGIALVVGHQRRMTSVYRTMKKAIDEGAIGDVYLIRAALPGDLLSDASHTIDSLMFLNGDADVKWVLGQIHRDVDEKNTNVVDRPGYRYGHPVENGAIASMEFANGVRAELITGDMRLSGWNLPYPGWAYQDIEIFGTKGRIWRSGDMANPPLRIFDEKGGWRELPVENPVANANKEDPNETHGSSRNELVKVFDQFALMINEGADHPLRGEMGMKGLEILMAAYESARLRKKLKLPLEQDRFPLEIMIEEGTI